MQSVEVKNLIAKIFAVVTVFARGRQYHSLLEFKRLKDDMEDNHERNAKKCCTENYVFDRNLAVTNIWDWSVSPGC
jgi:hypothetical protein